MLFLCALMLSVFAWRYRKKPGITQEVKGVLALAAVSARLNSAPRTDSCHILSAMASGDARRVRLAARKLDAKALYDGRQPLLLATRGTAPYKDSLSEPARLLFRRAALRTRKTVGVDALLDVALADPSFAAAVNEARRVYTAETAQTEGTPGPSLTEDNAADVVFHNDEKTAAALVLEVLKTTFGKDDLEAFRLMLMTHHTGLARLGPYSRDEAERLAREALRYAREKGAPLRIDVEAHGGTMAWGG
jgi:ATP-dependent Clp protease adapter protein ClpS